MDYLIYIESPSALKKHFLGSYTLYIFLTLLNKLIIVFPKASFVNTNYLLYQNINFMAGKLLGV